MVPPVPEVRVRNRHLSGDAAAGILDDVGEAVDAGEGGGGAIGHCPVCVLRHAAALGGGHPRGGGNRRVTGGEDEGRRRAEANGQGVDAVDVGKRS